MWLVGVYAKALRYLRYLISAAYRGTPGVPRIGTLRYLSNVNVPYFRD